MGLVKLYLTERKIVGHVIPHQWTRRELDRFVERFDPFVRFTEFQIGTSQADVKHLGIGIQGDRFFQFRHRLLKLARLNQHLAQVGLRVLVQWRYLELFAKRPFGLRVLLLAPESLSQQVVSVIVERIDFGLLLKYFDRGGVLALRIQHPA